MEIFIPKALSRQGWLLFGLSILCFLASPLFGQTARVNGIELQFDDSENLIFEALTPLLGNVKSARIVHLVGDGPRELGELNHWARRHIIAFLHERAGYDVLVLPVGIFEGFWVDTQLRQNHTPTESADTVYRIWRESPAFLEILGYVQHTTQHGAGLQVTGGLCRYHATGKELYTPHLIRFFEEAGEALLPPETKAALNAHLAGRGRLSRATTAQRTEAAILVEDLRHRFAQKRDVLAQKHGMRRTEQEAQFLTNMQRFVALEQIRAGDVPEDADFGQKEKQQNLDWFLAKGFPGQKLIYWEGRGANNNLPVSGHKVFTISLTFE